MTFKNEAMIDFSVDQNRQWIPEAFARVRAQMPYKVNAWVDGQKIEDLPTRTQCNPSNTQENVSEAVLATNETCDQAFVACKRAMKTWAKSPAESRAAILRKAAELMRAKKTDLTALISLEAGKNLYEADADFCEAVDFCMYYADEMDRLAPLRKMGDDPGELNQYGYKARGTTVAIAPWNFPFAILCGMTVAPLVCGNPVIMKPAEQCTAIAQELYFILREAGVPTEALHLIPGYGHEIGAYMVSHPQTHIITFTGSKAVGLEILENSAKLQKGQTHIKKVVCEMGGKNFCIIDDDADLDEAVVGSIHAAFGFQGQKCSALSRLLVHENCYDRFKERFIAAMQSLKMGPADDVSAKIGPVIDAESYERIQVVLSEHRDQIVAQLDMPTELTQQGYFVPPTIMECDDLQSPLGQNEFFAPIVTLFKVKSFDDAIVKSKQVDYALTGGIYSRSPEHIARAKDEMEVGNFYINRAVTGAVVYKQPFGGYKLSGAGGKAGGPDYLVNFLEPYTLSENTMRRGFAPEL